MLPVGVHVDGLQRIVHPLADFSGRDAQVFRGEGHVLFHHVGYNLVVRVLEHHAHRAADVQQAVLVGGVDAVHVNRPSGGQKDGVHVLGQSRFPAAVVAQDGHEGALFNGQGHSVQHHRGDALGGGVGEVKIIGTDNGGHGGPSDSSKVTPYYTISWAYRQCVKRRKPSLLAGRAGVTSGSTVPRRRRGGPGRSG